MLGAVMRCDDGIACTIDACSEDLRRCLSSAPDTDGDGSGDHACADSTGNPLGDDCDDADGNRYPGNPELCDPAAHDEDCDPATHGGTDSDGDGYESALCCNGTGCGDDCNDGRRDTHPGAVEVCNGIDDDCEAGVDEGVTIDVYTDADHDGDGAMGATVMHACASTAGVSVYHTDCDDADATRSGRLVEVCDRIDNDCDGTADDHTSDVTWYRDADMDGFGSPASGTLVSCVPPMGYSLLGTDCDDSTNTRSPGRAEICDGLDDDCNGLADYRISAADGTEDDDGDGIADLMCGSPSGRDCNDLDPSAVPGSDEACDGRDNDCDTRIDEGVTSATFFRDLDGDGYGSEASGAVVSCTPSAGYVRRGGDCDDASIARHPGGAEGCNAIDDDCDGAIDEGSASAMCALPHTQSACIGGACSQVACDDGFAECTYVVAGCETNVASDPQNCGRCGNGCGVLGLCTAGVCSTIIPVAGLVAHYDAQAASTLTLSGSMVLGWSDTSGLGHDLVPSSGTPALAATAINGHPAVDFTSAGLVSNNGFFLNSEITVFFVLQERMPGDWGNFGHHGNRDYDWSLEQLGNLTGQIHLQSASDGAPVVTLTTGTNYVVMGRIRTTPTTSRDTFVYSTAGGSAPMGANVSTSTITPGTYPLYIGASDVAEYSNAYIGEVLYYQRALTDTETGQVVAYLRTRWGI